MANGRKMENMNWKKCEQMWLHRCGIVYSSTSVLMFQKILVPPDEGNSRIL
jgi:hypothetical protein